MAILNIFGWETGDSIEATSTAGTFSVQTTVKRTGGYALQVNPTTTGTGEQRFAVNEANGTNGDGNPAIATTMFVRFYFRYATKPSADSEEMCNLLQTTGGTRACRFELDSDGHINAFDTAGQVGTGTTVLAQDTWYRIEIKEKASATVGIVELKIDGVEEYTTAVANTSANAVGKVSLGKILDRNGETIDFFYDDLSISSVAYPGSGQVEVMQPDADGSTQAWVSGTGATFAEIDEIPTSTADYVMSASGAGDIGLFDFESAASAGISGTIAAVKVVIRTRENTAVTSATNLRLFSNATASDTTAFDGSTTTVTQAKVVLLDPNTAAAWTTGGLDAVEAGAVEANAVATRMSSCLIMVDFVPAAPAGSTYPGYYGSGGYF